MPTSYAHRRFGEDVLRELPWDIREVVLKNREIYNIGLHGADILFYHDPYLPNGICRMGSVLHSKSGLEVFTDCYETITKHDRSPLYYSYTYGYLCHFILDCICHGYIHASEFSHFEVEMEFDRALMTNDGLDPFSFQPCSYLVPSVRNCAVVSAFYPKVKPKDIQASIRSMSDVTKLLSSKNKITRRAVTGLLHLTGKHYSEFRGLIMSEEPNPECAKPVRRLWELYKFALPLAKKLISEYEYTMSGKIKPDSHYYLNFESEKQELQGT